MNVNDYLNVDSLNTTMSVLSILLAVISIIYSSNMNRKSTKIQNDTLSVLHKVSNRVEVIQTLSATQLYTVSDRLVGPQGNVEKEIRNKAKSDEKDIVNEFKQDIKHLVGEKKLQKNVADYLTSKVENMLGKSALESERNQKIIDITQLSENISQIMITKFNETGTIFSNELDNDFIVDEIKGWLPSELSNKVESFILQKKQLFDDYFQNRKVSDIEIETLFNMGIKIKEELITKKIQK